MFSQKIYAEIARATQKALDDMHNATTINQVTVILGCVQPSSRNVPGYDDELRTAINRLLELARAENQRHLADALAIPWTAEDFVLYESRSRPGRTALYVPLERYRLVTEGMLPDPGG